MAEKNDSGAKKESEFDPDKRFKYVGFEVHTGKIKDLFKSEAEKEKLVEKIRAKRKRGTRLREETTFDVPRVAVYEKVVLTVTSLVLIFSLFLPWFSGYHEHLVETEAAPVQQETAVVDSLGEEMTADPAAVVAGDTLPAPAGTVEETELAESSETPAEDEQSGSEFLEKDERGFASITAMRKRKAIRKEHQEASALGALSLASVVFSSGFVLKITGIFFLIYMLLCVASGAYTLYTLYAGRGDPDTKALQLKKALRINWIPVGIWIFCLIISFLGASYSFDTGGVMKQIGTSYGIATYLSILGYGFYISLACFIMNAVKAIEI